VNTFRGKLVGSLIAATVLLAIPSVASAASSTGPVKPCNGSVELCSRTLDNVVLPGSHNSMSAEELGWFNPNQTYSIPNQLKRGARAFLFDTHYGKLQPNGQVRSDNAGPGDPLYLCHESCLFGASPLVPELEEVANYLKANPNEVLVVVNQDAVEPADFADAVEASGLLKYIYTGPAGPWPTLGEMIATNQRVVMTAEQDAAGVPWYHRAYDGAVRETKYNFPLNPALLTDPEQLDTSCLATGTRGEGAATANSLFLMNHWISQSAESGSFEPLIEWAEVVNQKDALVNRARACEAQRGFLPSILAVDFFGTGDVVGAARELNGVEAKPFLTISRPRPARTRAGRVARLRVTVSNDGDGAASSLRICATAPRRLVRRTSCRSVGTLQPGTRRTTVISLRTSSRARGRGAVRILMRTSARPLGTSTALTVTPVRRARGR
jgi:hypothetical protein